MSLQASPIAKAPPRDCSKIRVLDLFAGCGGLTQGFHLTDPRFTTVRAIEMDRAAAASYSATFGDEIVFHGSIQDWLRDEDVPQVDIVVGGPPCQGFSQLGRQDLEDERNLLWLEYAETVKRAMPRYFVMENVPAFLTSEQFHRFRGSVEKGGLLEEYDFEAHILNASEYGTPQKRRRVVVIGWHRDLPNPGCPKPSHSPAEELTVRDAFRGVRANVDVVDLPKARTEFRGVELPGVFTTPQLHVTRNYQPISHDRFAAIPPGGSRFDLPDRLKAPCWIRHKSGSGDVMGRLFWDRPSVTIRTEFTKPEKGRYIHPSENRALTPYEGALLQGFPSSHRWVGSKTSIVRQIGNAVPVPLARAIAAHLLSFFEHNDHH